MTQESRGFWGGNAKPPTAVFLEEYSVFLAQNSGSKADRQKSRRGQGTQGNPGSNTQGPLRVGTRISLSPLTPAAFLPISFRSTVLREEYTVFLEENSSWRLCVATPETATFLSHLTPATPGDPCSEPLPSIDLIIDQLIN